MSWADLLLFAVFGFWGGALFSLWRQNRRVISLMREMAINGLIADRVISALVNRISPRGHVDLTVEEVETASRPEVYRHEDGTVRILAK